MCLIKLDDKEVNPSLITPRISARPLNIIFIRYICLPEQEVLYCLSTWELRNTFEIVLKDSELISI